MDIDALRRDTPGTAHRLHLNNAGAALLSRPTLDAVTAHLELEATIGGYEAARQEQDRIDATYTNLARLIGGRPDEIALFDNSTHAWNAAFYALTFKPGDRILTGRAEYGSNVLAYLQVARRTGAEIVVVPDDPSGQLDTAALADLIDERTRLVGISHIPTSGGLINPAAEIGRITRAAGVPFLLDATQSVGQFPVDVEAIGCDMLTATGRKFLRGPRGTGFLWVRTEALEYLDPYVTEIHAATWDGGRGFTWQPGARRFETWEVGYAGVLGLDAAVRQALDLGLDRIGERALALGAYLRDRLDALPGVTTHDLGTHRCAIVTAKVDGLSATEVADGLARQRINVTTTDPAHTQFDTEHRGVHPLVRLSPHYYNTEAELDRTVEVMADLARTAR
ncbi:MULTISPECIES: aminotransferase class V-fold PLP-dependent enzyme [unclassified Streptomyces]|uniref:aminotransferase class V-fold PLP-dependent enzyme n=1 Tax=unclassified Streptomyces TaxID=2593676 RepID=UPI002E77094E|nr:MULTISPECIES: aminotransferase class V-fold PLP-dependent enzyme [unclassified Streptomyces]MEE1761245.1 aminotransferase class V-fold PLP-dependent enzyme [Streptomyces sp. SP18BB07]MEE1832565.1 aminotransferase class V-fold PLP-dependent enzyme [Streptomyces sp. SP17KL33]